MPTITIHGVPVEMRKGTGTGWVFATFDGREFGPFVTYEEARVEMGRVVEAIEERHARSLSPSAA